MTICAMAGALSGLGLAETWNGKLLDADCASRHNGMKACDAKRSTTAFLLDVNGTRYKLDSKSNEGTRAAMQLRSSKTSNPFATKAVPVNAEITGRLRASGKIRGDIIAVE